MSFNPASGSVPAATRKGGEYWQVFLTWLFLISSKQASGTFPFDLRDAVSSVTLSKPRPHQSTLISSGFNQL